MKPPDASTYPELRRVFKGYLHEDYAEEHGTPADAVQAFQQDADAGERRRFATEAKRFLRETEELAFDELKALVARLGSRWTPVSRQALVELLNVGVKRERRRSR